MKTFNLLFLSLFVCSSVLAQDMEKTYFERNPALGGDVVIKSTDIKVIGEEIWKTFEIESLEEGTYYLDAWIMVPVIKEGYPEFKIAVNSLVSESTFKPQTANWQAISLTDKKKSVTTVKLKKGQNQVSVIGKGPEIPNVEFIKLSRNALNAGISDKKYKEFVEKIKSHRLIDVKYGDSIAVATRSSSLNGVNLLRGTAGETYDYVIDMPVYYTTRLSFSFSSGQSVSISTSQSGSYEHVIELFHSTNASSYSWSSLGTTSGSLNVSIPSAGTYYLRIRSYRQYTSGLVNLTVNGTSYPNCVVAGTGMAKTDSYTTPSNFFTSKIKNGGDTWLFLEDNSSLPGKIRAHNDDGGSKSDGYSWGVSSLVTTSLTNINSALVSAYSSNSPAFTCDLYMCLPPITSSLKNIFTNLASDNSFISGPYNGSYNCISWSVGKTNVWDWISLTNLSLWDNYYQGYGYTRSGATADNAAIALWMYNGEFTHATVRKNSTISKPHGFEWESKCGALERVMHIRDAIGGNAYGSIAYYYKPISGTVNSLLVTETENENSLSTRSVSPQQSFFISDLNTESRFTPLDLSQIAMLKARISAKITTDFDEKYLKWQKTWNNPEIAFYSNPYKYAESVEYDDLLKYCTKYGKSIWPLFIDKLAQGEVFVVNLLKDLTYAGNMFFIDEITPSYRGEVGKQVPSLYSNLVDYTKQLLANEQDKIIKSIQDIPEQENEALEVNLSTNGQEILFNLYSDVETIANVKLYNTYGSLEYESIYNVSKGNQTVVINASNLKDGGIYIAQIKIGDKTISQKINISKR